MARNFILEAQLKEAAGAAGALESALEDFAMDVETFAITNAGEIPAWIEKCRTEKPHRFAIQSDHDAERCQKAFLFKNKTEESRLFRDVGEKRFNELKALYSNGLPESQKNRLNGSADHKSNPWNAAGNTDQRGRYTDAAIAKQMSFCRAVGPEKAAQVAAGAGCRLGDLYAAGCRRIA
jgi:hypothetical protein